MLLKIRVMTNKVKIFLGFLSMTISVSLDNSVCYILTLLLENSL